MHEKVTKASCSATHRVCRRARRRRTIGAPGTDCVPQPGSAAGVTCLQPAWPSVLTGKKCRIGEARFRSGACVCSPASREPPVTHHQGTRRPDFVWIRFQFRGRRKRRQRFHNHSTLLVVLLFMLCADMGLVLHPIDLPSNRASSCLLCSGETDKNTIKISDVVLEVDGRGGRFPMPKPGARGQNWECSNKLCPRLGVFFSSDVYRGVFAATNWWSIEKNIGDS